MSTISSILHLLENCIWFGGDLCGCGEFYRNRFGVAPFQTTVAEIEKETNIVFEIPDSKTNKNEMWPVESKEFHKTKSTTCSL